MITFSVNKASFDLGQAPEGATKHQIFWIEQSCTLPRGPFQYVLKNILNKHMQQAQGKITSLNNWYLQEQKLHVANLTNKSIKSKQENTKFLRTISTTSTDTVVMLN